MSIITQIKKLFKGGSRKVQVWDTSAISNHLNAFVQAVSGGKVQAVVPEGVVHELSEGRKIAICKRAYEFITKNDDKIRVEVTPPEARSWSVDEQVVHIAAKLIKKGYDVVLVTSDRDQSYRAKLREIETKYMEVFVSNRPQTEEKVENYRREKQQTKTEAHEEAKKFDFNLPCITRGKVHYVNLQQFLVKHIAVEVLDGKGKRKIAKDNSIIIVSDDKIIIDDVKYKVQQMHDNYIGLNKC